MITISPEDWADLVRRVEAVEAVSNLASPALLTENDLLGIYGQSHGQRAGLRAVYELGRQHGRAGL